MDRARRDYEAAPAADVDVPARERPGPVAEWRVLWLAEVTVLTLGRPHRERLRDRLADTRGVLGERVEAVPVHHQEPALPAVSAQVAEAAGQCGPDHVRIVGRVSGPLPGRMLAPAAITRLVRTVSTSTLREPRVIDSEDERT